MISADQPLAPRPARLPAWENLEPKRRATWKEWMSVYAAQVEELDTAIGRLLAAVHESGQEANTLVLFFSDNGGAAERPVKTITNAPLGSQDSYEGYALEGAHVSCTPLRRTKSFVHEGGVSSPLILHWPDGIPANRNGTMVDDPVHIIDMMASFVDLAGATFPKDWNGVKTKPMEGISMAPSFAGQALHRTAPLFWEHEGNHAVLDGKWKLVAERNDPWELYDMETDRTESRNLAEEQPERVKQLLTEYEEWTRRTGVLPWPKARPSAIPTPKESGAAK
jgi:arylsulfatase A-like enzyme